MAAVQDAAMQLLAERGPREVMVRDVAERAGVNHALVHRHFGTKDELIRSVITEQSKRIGAEAAQLGKPDVEQLLELLRAHPAYWRVLARTVLDAPQTLAAQRLPAASTVLGMIAGDATAATDETRAAAAVAGSLALGWLVFGPHLTSVLDVRDDDAFEAAVARTIRAAMRGSRSRAQRGEQLVVQ
jgi:AcrR family transcriptional regulator